MKTARKNNQRLIRRLQDLWKISPTIDSKNLPTSGRNQTNDVPDDSFLLTDTAATPSVEQRTSTTSKKYKSLDKGQNTDLGSLDR